MTTSTLINNIIKLHLFEHDDAPELIETHVSYILLVGAHAYKFKKSVAYPFLDFSTLDKRKYYCELEISLNKRTANNLYLALIPIYGTAQQPSLLAKGPIIEYAIQMRRFARSQQLDILDNHHQLTNNIIINLAHVVAHFHASISCTPPNNHIGDPHILHQLACDNFTACQQLCTDPTSLVTLKKLSAWTNQQFDKLNTMMRWRLENGFVRALHGDLHLGNIVLENDVPLLFDCLEFNPEYQWLDVVTDYGFLIMDLESRGHWALANLFLNEYLSITGDYQGLQLLAYAKCYRAMVRAKVALLTAQSMQGDAAQKEREKSEHYIALADSYTCQTATPLIITHGISGTGKTYISEQLICGKKIIRVRSDVERKRLNKHLQDVDQHYSPQQTEKTYQKLSELAKSIIHAGYSVIIDATFLEYKHRTYFKQLAEHLHVPFYILSLEAPLEIIKKRLALRSHTDDASEANLDVVVRQLAAHVPLTPEEDPHIICVHPEDNIKLLTEKLLC